MADQSDAAPSASTETKRTPQSLITEEQVKAALKADKGGDARLTSWAVKDFTKKGDNYACVVTSIEVQYSASGSEREVTYVAKLNPCRQPETLKRFATAVFEKEIGFYEQIAPVLNAELVAIGQDPLKFAKCFALFRETDSEVIILEDLRKSGFQMFDRKKGMDKAHATLVVKELGRLHAASVIMMNNMPCKLGERYPFILKDFSSFNENSYDDFSNIFSAYLNNAAAMTEKIGGYGNVVTWMRETAPVCVDLFDEQLKSSPPFEVICHGDCWNNNVLFRYNDEGVPTDVRLVDLQVCRKASPATDLNYLLYTSLNGGERREHLDSFLKSYHNSFCNVLKDGDRDAPFTLEDLKGEYHNKNLFGLLMAVMIVPIVVSEAAEMLDLDNIDTDDVEVLIKDQRERSLQQVDNNPLLKPRLLSVFDEMIEYKVICVKKD